MADRMHPYSMFPQNISANPLQQSQISQQPPQSQQSDPQMISALSNPEHARMWQQMNQLQNSYRPQQSGDLATSQMNHQEFARGQALSHGQGQPIVRQIQQSFGLNTQRMNPPGPVFHDPQANQPQSLIPPNFSNVPMNTQQQMKATFNMNPMAHAAMSNPGVSRQLKMLNQQEIVRLQQSGLGVQHAPNQSNAVDMFASTSMQPSQDQMHGSPHPAAQPVGPSGPSQGMVPGSQQPGVRKATITPAEFQERKTFLLASITQSERNVASLLQTAQNMTSIDQHMQQKLAQHSAELAKRKEMYSKLVATFGAIVTQHLANGMPPSNMPHINPVVHSTSQQPAAASNAQVQPGFVAQASQPVNPQYNNIPAGNGPSPMPTQNQSAPSQQIPIPPTQIVRPNTIPPRTGSTPHQISGGQLPNMSPNPGNFVIHGGQKVPNQARQPVVMPLDKQRFESTYSQFCRSQNINTGLRVTIGENRMVDLHQLHAHVMHEGGAQLVNQQDMWPVIGGRLGFIQFPGTDSEPARCGPGIAQQLQHTYEQCLQHFEHAYVLTVRNRPTTGSPQQPIQQINQNPPPISNNATPGMSGNPPEMPSNPRPPLYNQQLVAAAARYARMSVHDMRAQHVQEQMIDFVERHRSELLKFQQMQLLAKRNAEQEQQNIANAQGRLPNIHEQASVNLQPGVQRPPQGIGANTMVSVPSGDTKMVNGSFMPENVAAALHKQPPTQDQIYHAISTINQLKLVFQQRLYAMNTTQPIPDEHRLEYNQLLEQVFKMTSELDTKLHMYFVVFKNEDLLRKYVAIVMTVARQRQLVSTSSPQYIINLTSLRTMHGQIHKLNEEFENRWRAVRASAVAAAANPQQHASLTPTPRVNPAISAPPTQNTSHLTPASQGIGRPSSINPSPPHQSLQPPPQSHSQPNPSQPHSHQPSVSQPIKKPFRPSIPPSPSAPPAPSTLASPTPPPAVAISSTPATSAPTPQTTAGSPQTPKSPPSRVVAKNKSTTRATRKLSTAGKGPATPDMAPSVVGVKRPPEEDVAALTSVAPSEAEASNVPSPKKAKTEWEGETSEALLKKQQELENIKTEDDAAAFFDRMKEYLTTSASTDNEIHHDIASTLDQLLAGVAQEPADAAATAAALSVHGVGDAGPPPTALSPHMGPANDAFLEYIDFSSFTTLEDEDSDSKAPTPDLVPSSETNPSPESGSEGDLLGGTGSPDKAKIEEPGDRSDPLRLGSLREIDGGESAYYQADNWKWEGPMHTLDQPWAIFTS